MAVAMAVVMAEAMVVVTEAVKAEDVGTAAAAEIATVTVTAMMMFAF
jgi:hypothetical protein